jgi:hypothetical protein
LGASVAAGCSALGASVGAGASVLAPPHAATAMTANNNTASKISNLFDIFQLLFENGKWTILNVKTI